MDGLAALDPFSSSITDLSSSLGLWYGVFNGAGCPLCIEGSDDQELPELPSTLLVGIGASEGMMKTGEGEGRWCGFSMLCATNSWTEAGQCVCLINWARLGIKRASGAFNTYKQYD